MTEHAAVIFVFFFLAEYASIVLMCILISILFIGGYIPLNILKIFLFLVNFINLDVIYYFIKNIYHNSIIEGISYSLALGIKCSIMIFIFI